MHHTLAYTVATGGAVTDLDMTAAADTEVGQRSSHYFLTEEYVLLAAMALGATVTRVNIQTPTLNAVARFNVYPINRALTVSSPPRVDNWFYAPPRLPVNEELTVKVTDTASEQATVLLFIAPPSWNRNIPNGIPPVPIFECRATLAVTTVANAWSGVGQLTFEQSLRGGTYAVVGAEFILATIIAVRFNFPRAPFYRGRKLKPAVIGTETLGNLPYTVGEYGPMVWGELGRFSTNEPPQCDVWSTAAAAVTVEGRLWLVKVSDDANTPIS